MCLAPWSPASPAGKLRASHYSSQCARFPPFTAEHHGKGHRPHACVLSRRTAVNPPCVSHIKRSAVVVVVVVVPRVGWSCSCCAFGVLISENAHCRRRYASHTRFEEPPGSSCSGVQVDSLCFTRLWGDATLVSSALLAVRTQITFIDWWWSHGH